MARPACAVLLVCSSDLRDRCSWQAGRCRGIKVPEIRRAGSGQASAQHLAGIVKRGPGWQLGAVEVSQPTKFRQVRQLKACTAQPVLSDRDCSQIKIAPNLRN